jgi:RNA polymerase I-specific transcription initiation factor RRN6
MAVGEGGHILRISTLGRESWGWDKLALRLKPETIVDAGEWVTDGAPIRTIKFALGSGTQRIYRVLMMQKADSTTIFEPEIRRSWYRPHQPTAANSGAFFKVFANPLFTISTDKTGGRPHSDVAFNHPSDKVPPRLAIIDVCGYWSIWDIVSEPTRPVLRSCGHTSQGPLQTLPSAGHGIEATHRLLWISLDEEDQPKLYLVSCDDTTVRFFDTAGREPQVGIIVARQEKAEKILDMRLCPLSSADVLVLTTTTLFWVSVERQSSGQTRLSVVLSCPHEIEADGDSLILSVSPEVILGLVKTCFVWIRSPTSTETSGVWLTKPTAQMPAQFYFQRVFLDLPMGVHTTSVCALPPMAINWTAMGTVDDALLHWDLFQVYMLREDLSLGYSVIALTPNPGAKVTAPTKRRQARNVVMQRTIRLRYIKDKFVLPDHIGDQFDAAIEEERQASRPVRKPKAATDRPRVEVSIFALQLQQNVHRRISTAVEPLPRAQLSNAIRATMYRMAEEAYLPLRTVYVSYKINSFDPSGTNYKLQVRTQRRTCEPTNCW